MQQNIGEKRICKRNIQNLIEQLYQTHVNSLLGILCIARLVTQPNPEKFDGDKTKLGAFFTQFNLKL